MPTPTPTPTETGGGEALAVLAGDVLVLRGAGLAAPETWALLCQAAQALQDLFLSNGGVVGGSGMGPVVTPHTLELTPRGRVTLRSAPPETARAYLPPEYRPGRMYSDTDSEKMWMYSLGRALLDTTPRGAALTGTGSVSPSSALQSVLAAMTEPDPHRRASLMNLLDVISEYCRTRLQTKPFSHIVMDMYREVLRCPQYAARKRIALQGARAKPRQSRPAQQQAQPLQPHFPKHHHGRGGAILFKAQSRNSRSQPNLLSLSGCDGVRLENGTRVREFQSQLNIPGNPGDQMTAVHHTRTNSQPAYNERPAGNHGYEVITGSGGSSGNLLTMSSSHNMQSSGNIYSDPIYSIPVKPFLSSQDVRHNGLPPVSVTSGNRPPNNHSQSVDVYGGITSRVMEDGHPAGRVCRTKHQSQGLLYHRQASNPQLRPRTTETNPMSKRCSVPAQLSLYAGPCDPLVSNCQSQPIAGSGDGRNGSVYGQVPTQGDILQQMTSSGKAFTPRGPVPPKPPRIITTLKRTAPTSGPDTESGPPVKPPRSAIKCGPRARRGKAVQRAPSRLYRAVGGPSRSLNKTRCVGPEFVVRANQQPKQLVVGDVKTASTSRVVVILLTGQRLEVTCDPQKITAGELFQAVVQAENLEENFTLGLAALLAGDFAILPPDTKLSKVAPPGWLNTGKSKGLLGLPTSFMLYFRLRFFLPSLRGIRSWCSKHLLYLQLRRCILEQQLVCSLSQLISLTGLALQAEFGNYSSNEHGCGDYFLIEHYVPESLVLSREQVQSELSGSTEALRAQLHQAHRDRFGLDTNKAEEMFISHSQSLSDYGAHYYIATLDTKELGKVLAQQMAASNSAKDRRKTDDDDNIYDNMEKSSDDPIYGKIDFQGLGAAEDGLRIPYSDEKKIGMPEELYAEPRERASKNTNSSRSEPNNNVSNNNHKNSNNNNNNHCGVSKTKRSNESGVWLAIHADGLKLFDRGGSPREKILLAKFQWRDIQTLSYSKSCLVVHTKLNNKRCKFKLRMDHRKSYFAFKLTSLHHQFFLKFRSELTSLQGLAAEFGVPLMVEPNSPPPKLKPDSSKNKISIAEATKKQQSQKFTMQLEEYQNKENENPQKKSLPISQEPMCYTPEEDALYAQVHARLEPEGASRDTEDESERGLVTSRQNNFTSENLVQGKIERDEEKLYAYAKIGPPDRNGYLDVLSKPFSSDDIDLLVRNPDKTEDIYAAINKGRQQPKKFNFPVPEEVWDVTDVTIGVKKTSQQVKTSSLPNYGTPRQLTGFRTPSLPRRLGVKMGTRAIYSSLQRDPTLADVTSDLESLSLKSDTTSSVRSASADSPLPEAYVLNADIRSDDETFRVPIDETMSASLMARLDELSFAEERILHSIQLERGDGGSIGLQVTEGSDGGVYVQAVSVGGSADMAGNVNKGDRIVAINGQSLLNLRYEEALKMLQSSAETVDLVLSQIIPRGSPRLQDNGDNRQRGPIESNYLQNIRFDMASELDATNPMATKWLGQKTNEVSSLQNTSSAYSSASSSAMGNHRGINSHYLTDVIGDSTLNSASILLGIEDFDLSCTSRQVFI